MSLPNPLRTHRANTKWLALAIDPDDVYHWLMQYGYYPEAYVLPPCFRVVKRPSTPRAYFKVSPTGSSYKVPIYQLVSVHFPKSDFIDRTFGIMHPEHYNDLAFNMSREWAALVDALIPSDSNVVSYTFPISLDLKRRGHLSRKRSGRNMYSWVRMVDDDIASISYRYTHLVRTDIKSFYPALYTHSIPWALHGKEFIRKPAKRNDFRFLGNRLDKLFRNANDGCTNGIPIGPVVSDIASELVAAGVDRLFTRSMQAESVKFDATRFKDDYRILVGSEADGRKALKCLQAALKEFNLELNDSKTAITRLPDGLFREWKSAYHLVRPRDTDRLTWDEFREMYLAVLRIDKLHPETGVVDRFLVDIMSKPRNQLRVELDASDLQRVFSMLLMLATRRIKAFPKVIAIIENIVQSNLGRQHTPQILSYLEAYLDKLARDEEDNKYLITWISYFLVSNDLKTSLTINPRFRNPITRSVFHNNGQVFKETKDFKIFSGCKGMGRKTTILKYLDPFDPPEL